MSQDSKGRPQAIKVSLAETQVEDYGSYSGDDDRDVDD